MRYQIRVYNADLNNRKHLVFPVIDFFNDIEYVILHDDGLQITVTRLWEKLEVPKNAIKLFRVHATIRITMNTDIQNGDYDYEIEDDTLIIKYNE